MQSCLIDLYFFPSLQYFKEILACDKLLVEANDNFVKQTYRNRAHVLGVNGVLQLNVPVQKAQSKQLYKDVKIDFSEDWRRKNFQTLKSAYSNSPFFDDYYIFIDEIFNKNHHYLFDLNISLLAFCLKALQIDRIIEQTSAFNLTYKEVIDCREVVKGRRKTPSDWLPNDIKSYQQMFGNKFVENLSVLDIMFNEGPASIKYLV